MVGSKTALCQDSTCLRVIFVASMPRYRVSVVNQNAASPRSAPFDPTAFSPVSAYEPSYFDGLPGPVYGMMSTAYGSGFASLLKLASMLPKPNGEAMSLSSGFARVARALACVRLTLIVADAMVPMPLSGLDLLRLDVTDAVTVYESLFLASWFGSAASPIVVLNLRFRVEPSALTPLTVHFSVVVPSAFAVACGSIRVPPDTVPCSGVCSVYVPSRWELPETYASPLGRVTVAYRSVV